LPADVTTDTLEALVDSRRDELVEFARELVAIPSPSPPGDERDAAALVSERLHTLGIHDVELHAFAPERPNVIAHLAGTGGGPTLLLNGHLDTKPPGDLDAWITPPWDPVIDGGMLRGLGSADMKGAVAAMVYAASALAEAGPFRGTLTLALTADEEAGGGFGARWLAEQGLVHADAAVIGEPCGIERDWEAIRLISRGAAIFRVTVRGTQMHSSLSDQLPSVNASEKLARLMTRLADEGNRFLAYEPHPLLPRGPTVNVGLAVSSGLGYGILPGEGTFLSDIRALPGMTLEGIEADLLRFLEQARVDDPKLEAELVFEGWTPACEIPAEHRLVELLAQAAESVLGRHVPPDAFPGGTDAPHFQLLAGVPTVPAFGPGLLTVAHMPNEAISVEAIVQAAKIYAVAARRFLDG
jgi:acetylornithine deacetylase